MFATAEKTIEKYHMISIGDQIIVGVSGGADSCALLFFLCQIRKKYQLHLKAVHINHGIRGQEAYDDEQFVVKFCQSLEVPFRVHHINVLEEGKKRRLGEEETGRLLRYEIFQKEAEEMSNSKIAVAHHENDQAETVLMRLCRGAGLLGISGISPVRGNVIRPLIECSRNQIEEYCRIHHIDYRTDCTNLDRNYTRNRIRLELIPYLEENLNPKAVSHIARSALLLREEEEYLTKIAQEKFSAMILQTGKDWMILSKKKLIAEPDVIKRRIIRLAVGLQEKAESPTKEQTECVVKFLPSESEKRIDISNKVTVIITRETVWLGFKKEKAEKREYSYSVKLGEEMVLQEIGKTAIFTLKSKNYELYRDRIYTKVVDYDKIKNKLEIRTRQPKDRIYLKGVGNKKIKDLFIDSRIPKEERALFPLIADGNEIIWVPGLRVSEKYYVDAATKNFLCMEIREDKNNERTD